MIDNFPERIKHFRSKRGLSQTELSNLAGISQKQISDYEMGNSVPRQKTYFKLLEALDITNQEFKNTLIYKDVNTVSGIDFFSFQNEKSNIELALPTYIAHEYHVDASTAIPTRVNGQSMMPLLNDGDIALIDTSQTQPQDGKVFAINFFNEELIARVFRNPDGTLLLSRDNRDYPPKTINPDDIEIIGKLVYRMGGI